MSLYLRYRPKTLDELKGQDPIQKTLKNAFVSQKISHAYLFSGPRGTGKTSTARLVASSLSCSTDEQREQAREGRFIDIIEIDAASNRGIEEIRALKEKINFSPVISSVKVYIIDEVHMLTKEAFNALLKTLEEPPSHAYFILATTEVHKIPETILSRCQHFSFSALSEKDIQEQLEYVCKSEGVEYEKEALGIIAKHSFGGMRNALSSLEQVISHGKVTESEVALVLGISVRSESKNFAFALLEGETKKAMSLLSEVLGDGVNISAFLRDVLFVLREYLLSAENDVQEKRCMECISAVFLAEKEVKSSLIPQLPVEMMCISLGRKLPEEKKKEEGGIFHKAFSFVQKEKEETVPVKEKEGIVPTEEKKAENISLKAEVFNKENVQKLFLECVSQMPTPSYRASLKTATVVSVENETVVLEVGTDFYVQSLTKAQAQKEMREAFFEMFHKNLSFEIQKKPGMVLEPVQTEPKESVSVSNSVIDMANEIFKE
jgi:DNA polymerase-3 subunit gamma/tau